MYQQLARTIKAEIDPQILGLLNDKFSIFQNDIRRSQVFFSTRLLVLVFRGIGNEPDLVLAVPCCLAIKARIPVLVPGRVQMVV